MPRDPFDAATIMGALYGDGIMALKSAFGVTFVQELREDIEVLFEEALKRRRRPRPTPLLRRDSSGAAARIRRARHAPMGDGGVGGDPRPAVQDHRDRF
jgi:hypothetical protein